MNKEYGASLKTHIEKLFRSLPSDHSETEALQLEQLLNEIYVSQVEAGCSEDIEKALIESLSLASFLAHWNKRFPNKPRTPEYFKSIKNLTRLLKVIYYYLTEPLVNQN